MKIALFNLILIAFSLAPFSPLMAAHNPENLFYEEFDNYDVVADIFNSGRTCDCIGLPGNAPVVALFHKSRWGSSGLIHFKIGDTDSMMKCKLKMVELKEMGICR